MLGEEERTDTKLVAHFRYYLKPRSAGLDVGSEQGELRVQVEYSLSYLLPSAHYQQLCRLLWDSVSTCITCPSIFVCTSLGVLDILPRVSYFCGNEFSKCS